MFHGGMAALTALIAYHPGAHVHPERSDRSPATSGGVVFLSSLNCYSFSIDLKSSRFSCSRYWALRHGVMKSDVTSIVCLVCLDSRSLLVFAHHTRETRATPPSPSSASCGSSVDIFIGTPIMPFACATLAQRDFERNFDRREDRADAFWDKKSHEGKSQHAVE